MIPSINDDSDLVGCFGAIIWSIIVIGMITILSLGIGSLAKYIFNI